MSCISIFQHPPRLADDNASTKTENTMSNLSLKMNNQDVERFEHQVDDMYSILVNISSELVNIKVRKEYLYRWLDFRNKIHLNELRKKLLNVS